MKLVIGPIVGILSYAIALYILNYYGFLFGIEFVYGTNNPMELVKVYFLIGIIFWLVFSVLKFVLDILTLPLQYMTLRLTWWFTNIFIMFVCQFIINFYLTGIEMHITSLARIIVTSAILWLFVSSVSWLINKII